MLDEKQKLFKISINVVGIKKRCRKVERHFLRAGYVPYNDGEFNKEELEQKVKDVVSSNMKTVTSDIIISLDFVELSVERGYSSELWQPFSKLNKSWKVLSGLENQLQ